MFLVGFKSHGTRENTCEYDQEPSTKKLIVPRGKFSTIILLERHSIKLPFKYKSLNQYIY